MKTKKNNFLSMSLILLLAILDRQLDAAVAGETVELRDNLVEGSLDEKDTNTISVDEKVVTNTADTDHRDDTDQNHLIPASIAEATLVGARLRQQEDVDSSHPHNNEIDINLLEWAELPTAMKDAAITLGCNAEMWDGDEESSQCELFWAELTPEQQKAAMVLGYQSSSWDNGDDENEQEDEDMNVSDDEEDDNDSYQNPKIAHVTGCHHGWGTMGGCNKASTKTESSQSKINATPGVIDNEDSETILLHQPSLAGSATAKIEAHVMKGAGKVAQKLIEQDETITSSCDPPQGFTLSARIVTSPHDGLSYFLDVPQEDIATMMTIPYTYLDCGENIESLTEAFSLDDMVVRHLPAGADIGHWVNLGGGVTIDSGDEDEDSSRRYINGNHDGRPKLLIALTPIEIVVSGNDEESRTFNPGEIILMEDTLGKGHKMRANSRGKDLSVIMISLPHTVHYPTVNWSSSQGEQSESLPSDSAAAWHSAAHQSLFGFAPNHQHPRSKARNHTTKPCPLEYESARSSLLTPRSHTRSARQKRHQRKTAMFNRINFIRSTNSSDDSTYLPPLGFSTYNDDKMSNSIFNYLPSLRRSMLIGIGLSLTSSFVYCAQLLYPPFLVLWGGATVVALGTIMNIKGVRWLYQQNWMVVWEEERRWKREVKRQKKRREESDATKEQGKRLNDETVSNG